MPLTYADIADIIREVDRGNLDQLTFDVGDVHVEIRRRGAAIPAAPEAAAPAAPEAVDGRAGSGTTASGESVALGPGEVAIRSPMVGTFYRRPSPDAPPFAEQGAVVNKDDPLCLLEVMKLFTTVHASHAGRVARIAVEDGDVVEYDQLLFVIDTG